MANEKHFNIPAIEDSTVLGSWKTIINDINNAVEQTADDVVNSIGSVYSFNQQVTESFDEALEAGLTPCKKCAM